MTDSYLQLIYESMGTDKRRPKQQFYPTDLGSCPRKVMMNFFPEEFKNPQQRPEEKDMFQKANYNLSIY